MPLNNETETKEIINDLVDIKLRPFRKRELDTELKKLKRRKASGLDEITPEVLQTRKFDEKILRLCKCRNECRNE